MGKLHKLLYPHPAVTGLLTALSGAGLLWLFATGRENTAAACCFYPLCAYSLLVLCLALVPWLLRTVKALRSARGQDAGEPAFRRSLITGMAMNLVYALFQLAVGALTASPWTGSQGAYQLIMALIHLVLLGYETRQRRTKDPAALGWKGFQACGICLLILHLTMTGLVFQMVWQGEAEDYPGVLIFGVAAYTFYKLTMAIIRVAQYRKNANPLWGAAKNIDLSEATMNLFTLQAALLQVFSRPEEGNFRFLMNNLTGGACCLMTVLGAVGMITHGRKKQLSLQGDAHGRETDL